MNLPTLKHRIPGAKPHLPDATEAAKHEENLLGIRQMLEEALVRGETRTREAVMGDTHFLIGSKFRVITNFFEDELRLRRRDGKLLEKGDLFRAAQERDRQATARG